jgi:metal-sulfur cluster biosynthetic enzyme
MNNSTQIKENILKRLQQVIDPETGADVIRMQLVMDLTIDENGKASYIFRPSSPICPIAIQLAMMIMQAINEVEGVTGQQITVTDYIQAEELTQVLNSLSFAPTDSDGEAAEKDTGMLL